MRMNESPTIDIGDNIRLLGTAHVASASVAAVKEQVELFKPDVIAVELCESRHSALLSERRLDREGLLKVIKEGKAPMVLLQSMLASEQRRLGMDEGEQPGAEMLAAVNVAKEQELDVELVDRDIQTTLRRAWREMRFIEKIKIVFSLASDDDEEDEEEIDLNEMLSNSDLLTSMMEDLREFSPGAGKVLIDERDQFIASKIQSIGREKKVLAVLGAGHLSGVEDIIKNQKETKPISELNKLPEKRLRSTILKWMFPVLIFSLFGYFAYTGDWDQAIDLFTVWTVANAILAAIGCALARGHPLAILTAALASPITSLNPMLAAGWFAGYVQMRIKEPSGEDLAEFLRLEEIKSFWTNPAGRVLMVTALTNLGSMSGPWVAAIGYVWMTEKLQSIGLL